VPIEMVLWRVDDKPLRLTPSGMPTEERLEELIEQDPAILGEPLMIIGRQVRTPYAGRIDLLAIDGEGSVHVLELKRDKTPRDVVAQALDYGQWVGELTNGEVRDLFAEYRAAGSTFDAEFEATFGFPPPDDINTDQFLSVVASSIDPATERIIGYLANRYGVPINVVFFSYFDDGDRKLLARTWLLDQEQTAEAAQSAASKTKEPWNGTDWYLSFGEYPDGRSWDDGLKHGFVSAGGGAWFSRTLRNVPDGARVFVCIPGSGYVAAGMVTGPAAPFADAFVEVDGKATKLSQQNLVGTYSGEGDEADWVLPVKWTSARRRVGAYWKKGMFANQNTAAKLRNRFTLDLLYREFDVDTRDGSAGESS